MTLLWPDDVEIPSTRDGTLARMGGKQLYFFSRDLIRERPTVLKDHRAAITRHIAENASSDAVELMTFNIDEIIDRRPLSIRTKLNLVLSELARLTNFQVGRVRFVDSANDNPAYKIARSAGLKGVDELLHLLNYASEKDLVQIARSSSGAEVTITVDGVMYVETLGDATTASRTAFVAMWFGPEIAPAFSDGMAPAIEANGYDAIRIDRREHNNKIDDEIISEIRRCRFVVADFSCGSDGPRGGVYFEAGYALAKEKPVIFTVRASDLDKVHFDTRQFNHIIWENPAQLFERLQNRIAATIGPFGDQ